MTATISLLVLSLLTSCAGSDAPPPTPVPVTPAVDSMTTPIRVATGQSVYVPVYSHIYVGDETRTFDLTVTLSVRNTDANRPITLAGVRYFDTAGTLLHVYVDQPVPLGPLGSVEYVVREADTRGGAGANFLVDWTAEEEVTEPVIEAIMIGAAQQQGISFISPGRVVGRHGPVSTSEPLPEATRGGAARP